MCCSFGPRALAGACAVVLVCPPYVLALRAPPTCSPYVLSSLTELHISDFAMPARGREPHLGRRWVTQTASVAVPPVAVHGRGVGGSCKSAWGGTLPVLERPAHEATPGYPCARPSG